MAGGPDERYGEEIAALVKLGHVGAGEVTADHIRDFSRGRIAHFKVPRYGFFVDEFPMTVTGKVQKYLLRDRAIAELTPS